MNKVLSDYGKGYIVFASRPGNGKTSTILENIKKDLISNKKVLFFSLENNKESILKKGIWFNTQNLVILDNPIKDIDIIKENINKYNPDTVYIDYYDLLPNNDNINEFFHQLSVDYNIPLIVAHNLSMENDNYNLSDITIDKFIEINGSHMIDNADEYYLFYNNKRICIVKKLK